MTSPNESPVWPERFKKIDNDVEAIRFPEVDEHVDQDEEWCEAVIDGEKRRVRFHDYDVIYDTPGMYESLFYKKLKCTSPNRVVGLLEEIIAEFGGKPEDLKVLDVGAGNGMVGDELSARGVKTMVGIDLIPEAKHAAHRDRPGLYSDYFVADLTKLPSEDELKIRQHNLNCVTTVAALGYGDIPPLAFLKALDLISTPGWMAFNIKEDFLSEDDDSGFSRLVRQLQKDEYIQLQSYRRYRHRVSMRGEPLYYVAVVAKKLKMINDSLLDAWTEEEEESVAAE